MSLQFIMGPSGSGKSHYLYQYIIKESMENPEKNYIFLVPDQFKIQAEKALVAASPRKGLMNIEVLSFTRLAHRVLEETGENNRIILNDIGKNFVLRKLAGDLEEHLKILQHKMNKVGYISEIKSIISELIQYDVQPDKLGELLQKTEDIPRLNHKLSDIKQIYEAFREYEEGTYITGEELLDVLALTASKSEMLKGSVLVLDGFTGLTPVQNKLMRQLFEVCEKIVVSVTMDVQEDPYADKNPYQLFILSKQMVTALVRAAKETKTELQDTIYLYDTPVYRFKDNKVLNFLGENIFRHSKVRYEEEQNVIQVWCAKKPQEEIEFVAQKIRNLVRTEEIRYRDIAVISNGMDAYARHIERIFAKHEIPVFMDQKKSVLSNTFVEYIRSLLAMAEQNFTYESVFRYLKSGLTNLEMDEIDMLENYVVAVGIRGYKKWQTKWIRRSKYMDEEALSEVNRIREKFVNSVENIMTTIMAREKTVYDITKAIHELFLQEEIQKKLKEYQNRFEIEGELALEKEYAQIYRIVIELLDQFVELLGNEKMSLKEYGDLLDAGFEEAKVGIIPPSVDQVIVGDVERSRLKDIKVLFLVGTNDEYIPGNAQNKNILSELEREQIKKMGVTLSPSAKEQVYIQKFYLYLLLTKPTQKIYLTLSKTSSDGKSMRPAYLVSDMMRLFPRLQASEVLTDLANAELTLESGVDCLVQGLQNKQKGLSKEWQELYAWYKSQPEWKERIATLIEGAYYRKPEGVLGRKVAKRLYGETLENSVTRLEKYATCAYAHFLQYGLRLREREEYQFEALDLGNLFHSAIERFSKKLEKTEYGWTNIPESLKETLIEESVDECVTDYGNSILYSNARNEYIITRLKRMLKRTIWALERQLSHGEFVPKEYEISFTSECKLKDLGEMHLHGKIDRIDLYEDKDNVYVKVIDYKTGEKGFNLGELYHGIQLQLVIYMNAAVEMQEKIQKTNQTKKNVIPAGLFYYKMNDPLISKKGETLDVDYEILKALCPDGTLLNENAIAYMDRELVTDSPVIPVKKTTKGAIDKRSKILTEEDFSKVSEYVKRHVEKVGSEILEGYVSAAPYKMGDKTGCGYCPYHAVCGFDEKIKGYTYRVLENLKQEEALEKIREEAETWE